MTAVTVTAALLATAVAVSATAQATRPRQATDAAVRGLDVSAFQTRSRLTADGIVGRET
ncbi:hypothetical protein [Streptomyces sp. NPDC093261]|uniref:hypothetical protein n=1 Tax=Streptomyces sp. NPDC093261 TaxID=3366037 RepID=UPI003807566B